MITFAIKVIRNIFWKSLNRLARLMNLFYIFKTSVGIKQLNLSRLVNAGKIIGEEISLSPNALYLGPDYLKDEFTLLGISLLESPHYKFMNAIEKGKSLQDTDYFIRYRDAKLDWRLWQSPKCNVKMYKSRFEKSKQLVNNDIYSPVIVYKVAEKYYIYDGKHRASMCALLGKDVKCVEVSSNIATAFVFNFFFALIGKDKLYLKHCVFINEAERD